ncbi:MAG: hypothetical protein LBU65_11295 [Planctomycetaceae bacterium]|jgi:hypothetical protein|nr:hypothetical protein [Planctomycetaceae bacterium]
MFSSIQSTFLPQALSGKPLFNDDKVSSLVSKDTNKDVIDQLMLSQRSRAIDLLNLEMGQSGNGGDNATGMEGINDLKQRGQMMASVLKMKIDGFQQNLLKTLKSNGVDVSKPATVQDGGEAGMLLDNAHPDADKIKSLLQDEGLQSQFKEMSKMFELVQGLGQIGNNPTGAQSFSPANIYQQHSQPTESALGGKLSLRIVEQADAGAMSEG